MIRRLVVVVVVAALALYCASNPVEEGAPRSTERTKYSGLEVGPTPVGSIPDVVLTDNARNRDVTLTIDYPTRGGPHPVIVFSPGYGATNRGYIGLASYWAANNYVVFRINHGNLIQAPAKAEDVWANSTAADWRNRVRDITFTLDSIEKLTQRYPELEGRIDPLKIGVAGHSYGAHTAMLLGGVRTNPGAVSWWDRRVKAIVAMSPQGPSETRGFTRESFAELRMPALFITGTNDRGTAELETPEWRAEAFRLAPEGDKWLVTIEGARHATFTGRMDDLIEAMARERARGVPVTSTTEAVSGVRSEPRTGAEAAQLRQQEMFAIARGVALAFFDTYVRGDAAGRAALDKTSERRGVTVEKK